MKEGFLSRLLTILTIGTILLACSSSDTRDDQSEENKLTENERQKNLSDKDPEVILAIIQEGTNSPSERLVESFGEILNSLKGYYPDMSSTEMSDKLAKAYDITVEKGNEESLLQFVDGFRNGVENSIGSNNRYDFTQYLASYICFKTNCNGGDNKIMKFFNSEFTLPLNSFQESEDLTDMELKSVLQREIESLNKPFIDTLEKKIQITDDFDETELKSLSLRILVFAAHANLIQQAEQRSDVENKKLANALRIKTSERQKKEYPALRSRYGKIMAAIMWEHDFTIRVWGNDNSFISMTNSIFLQNKNIKDIYLSIKDALIMYRFKKIIFRAYRGGEETVIDIETPVDTELVLTDELQVK